MIELKDLLGRWSKILLAGEAEKESIRKIIKEEIGADPGPDGIKIQNGTIFLDLKPIYKSELLKKREKIEKALGKILRSPTSLL